jgi:hypothetical protein
MDDGASLMQEKKKPRVIKHCPHHGKIPLKQRRGSWSKRWVLFCPHPQCNHTEYKDAK